MIGKNSNSSVGKRYESIRLIASRFLGFVDFVLPMHQIIPWAVITFFIAVALTLARQFTGVGVVLSLSFTAFVMLVSLRVAAYMIWIAADIADDVRAIRTKLESVDTASPNSDARKE